MAGRERGKATTSGAAEASVRVWWSMFGKLADEEQKLASPTADLIERTTKVEDRLRLALAAQSNKGQEEPRPTRKAAKGTRLAKFKYVG